MRVGKSDDQDINLVWPCWEGACGPLDRALDSSSEGLGVDSQSWPCVEVSCKFRIPHCLGPPSHNGYLVHRSNIESIVAGCNGAHLARGKVKSVEHALSWRLDPKQLPLLLLSCYFYIIQAPYMTLQFTYTMTVILTDSHPEYAN